MKKFFKAIGAIIASIFHNLPKHWEDDVETVINGLNKAKKIGNSFTAVTVASLFPNGIGSKILSELQNFISQALPTLEIGKHAIQAGDGLEGAAKADAILTYVVSHINDLPEEWRDKHWNDIATKILVDILDLSKNEVKALIEVKIGQLKAKE